jgi:hypothetical protein
MLRHLTEKHFPSAHETLAAKETVDPRLHEDTALPRHKGDGIPLINRNKVVLFESCLLSLEGYPDSPAVVMQSQLERG